MKKGVICFLTLFIGFIAVPPAQAGLDDFLKDLKSAFLEDSSLSSNDIVKGLKQALEVGTQNAVTYVSKTNGYFNNSQIRIPLPRKIQKVENILRNVGLGKKLDAFELSINRAAEKAAPLAIDIFKKAILQMRFSDARQILDGPDDAATTYFKGATSERLHEAFKPVITQAMAEVGVTRKYQDLNNQLAGIPFMEKFSFDLAQYTTDKGLDGLFYMLAQEEKKIREDPAARVTEILKRVFGK